MIEAISKILDAIAKYAWGVLIVCLLVVILPDKATSAMGLQNIKSVYLGYWWLGLIFSAAIWGGSLINRSASWIRNYLNYRERKSVVLKRLYSLDDDEHCWISYCLLNDTQSLTANQTNQTANSLLNKGIVTQGTGSILCLPYHICDFVWIYLKKHKDEFLPPEMLKDAKVIINLGRFAKNLKEIF